MTHDFAKKKKTSRKKPPPKSRVPGWVWLFTGIVTGIFISFLGYLADITPEPAPQQQKHTAEAAKKESSGQSLTTKFDFYTLLPEREVIVPDDQEAADDTPAEPVIYILQAGSFKHKKDAESLRARLILMNLDAKIESVTVKQGDQWHRVQVGPFTDRSSLAKARSTLISEGIDTLVMKRKAG